MRGLRKPPAAYMNVLTGPDIHQVHACPVTRINGQQFAGQDRGHEGAYQLDHGRGLVVIRGSLEEFSYLRAGKTAESGRTWYPFWTLMTFGMSSGSKSWVRKMVSENGVVERNTSLMPSGLSPLQSGPATR